MRTFALALLLFATLGTVVHAAPSAAQTDDVREAVFRALFVRAKVLMPEAKVYMLEKEDSAPGVPKLITALDPSQELLQRFAAEVPPIVPFSQSHRDDAIVMVDGNEERSRRAHGVLLQIVSLRRLDDSHVQAETYVEAGLGRAAVSVPYTVTLQAGRWTAREDVRAEWRQAVQEGDIQAAVVRDEIVEAGTKLETPCFLSLGRFGEQASDPPPPFLGRFAHNPIPLQKGSLCLPSARSHDSWTAFTVQSVRWVSDNEVGVRGSSHQSGSMSADSYEYRVTRTKNGWKVSLLSLIGA